MIRRYFLPTLIAVSWLLLMFLPPLGQAARENSQPALKGMSTDTAREKRRLALVIGNNSYPQKPLKNPCNDAEDIASALKSFGFQVELHHNADLKTTRAAIDKFIAALGPDAVGLFYFAGHGMQIDGLNYLIPVDFNAKDEPTAREASYSASLLSERMENADNRLNIIILDACRNNPYRSISRRGLEHGLAAMYASSGTLIAFATGPGQIADDNEKDRNGLFTKYLIQSLKESPSCLDEVFGRARERVAQQSHRTQVPAVTTSVIGRFCFKEAEPEAIKPEIIKPEANNAESSSPPRPPTECKGTTIPESTAFSIDGNYEPSGIMGDIGDVRIMKLEDVVRFKYTTAGKGSHEWDYKFVSGELNPQPAQFGGVMYLNPPNNFGNVCGGFDLSSVRRVIKWEARSSTGDVYVEFIIGGVTWMWNEKRKVDSPYPDSMPRTSLRVRKLTENWQEFEFDLSKLPASNFTRVVNGFSWVISWGSNGVNLNDAGTGPERPKTFEIEIRKIRYER